MHTYESYKEKYGHLNADEKELRRKFYTYLEEQQMMMENVNNVAAAAAVSGGGGGGKKPRPVPDFSVGQFITSWKTDNSGVSSSTQIQLPLVQNGDYYFQVDWGDGNVDIIQEWDQKEARHTYATAGTYTVTIGGIFKGFIFSGGGDRLKLLSITQWGNSFTIMNNSFSGCANLTITATDVPLVENLGGAFAGCSSLSTVPNMNSWDVSQTNTLVSCFNGCTLFNTNIGSWNTSNVTELAFAFYFASSFNQNIGAWDVSKVTNMGFAFNSASAFNNGGSSSISNWNTSNCVNFDSTFRSAGFNQPIGTWDVSKTTTLRAMFRTSSFRQDLSAWRPRNCTNFTNTFLGNSGYVSDLSGWTVENGLSFNRFAESTALNFNYGLWNPKSALDIQTVGSALSTANYDSTLIAWAALPVLQRNTVLQLSSGVKYTAAAASARAYLISQYNWTIIDGGLQP